MDNRFTKIFEERLNSLLEDNYQKRVDTRLSHIWFVRLKHMANGNTIILRGYPHDGRIEQSTNGIIKHIEIV